MTDELEWQTRRDRINKKLAVLNPPWTITRYHPNLNTSLLDGQAIEEYPTHFTGKNKATENIGGSIPDKEDQKETLAKLRKVSVFPK